MVLFYKQRMKTSRPKLNKILVILGLTGVLGLFLLLTNPEHIALPLLIVPFVLIGIIIYQLARLGVGIFASNKTGVTSRLVPVSVAFIAVVFALLESLHQLTWKDSLLVAIFTVLFWVYLSRADFLK